MEWWMVFYIRTVTAGDGNKTKKKNQDQGH
jgi:hypothetical protein